MMSSKLRNALGAVAMTVIAVGPIIGFLMIVFAVGEAPRLRGGEFGRVLGSAVELAALSLLLGGILRALISIDARLEQKA